MASRLVHRRFVPSGFWPLVSENASAQRVFIKPKALGQFLNANRLPTISNKQFVAPVATVGLVTNPPAVVRVVARVVVDPVKRCFFWAFAHVGQKVLKVSPALANRNAAPAVSFEIEVVGISASLLHAVPGLIRWAMRLSAVTVLRFMANERILTRSAELARANPVSGNQGPLNRRPAALTLHSAKFGTFLPFPQEQTVIL
jgi:hypothetical protein